MAVSSSLNDVVAGQDDRDIVALARRRAAQEQPAAESSGGLNDFMRKLRAAWLIFFPERAKPLTPKEEGKRRLRMILVADRCGASQPGRQASGWRHRCCCWSRRLSKQLVICCRTGLAPSHPAQRSAQPGLVVGAESVPGLGCPAC